MPTYATTMLPLPRADGIQRATTTSFRPTTTPLFVLPSRRQLRRPITPSRMSGPALVLTAGIVAVVVFVSIHYSGPVDMPSLSHLPRYWTTFSDPTSVRPCLPTSSSGVIVQAIG